MLRLPDLGSPGCVLIVSSLILAFLGLISAFIGVASLLTESSDLLVNSLYLGVGVAFIIIAVAVFKTGIKADSPLPGVFSSDENPLERLRRAKTENERQLVSKEIEEEFQKAGKLTTKDREVLVKLKASILTALPGNEAVSVLNQSGHSQIVLANQLLQPIAFAMRPVTASRYVRGLLLEACTWVGVIIALPFILVIDVWRGGQAVLYRALRLRRRARQYRSNPHKIFQRDGRAPVLYLRSFSDDYHENVETFLPTTSEEKLSKHYNRVGPMIAVGKPTEDLPFPGASRVYFDEANWQAGVLYLMSISRLIIIQAGVAPGVLWELGVCPPKIRSAEASYFLHGLGRPGRMETPNSLSQV
jgi:hypothetical protein